MSYQWDFSGILRYGDMLLIGLFGTVKIAVISIVLGVVVGLLVALLRLSSNPWARKPAGAFIEFYEADDPDILSQAHAASPDRVLDSNRVYLQVEIE